MITLLPETFDELIKNAVQNFWTSRTSNASILQDGGRGSVIGGKNLDGFSAVIKIVAQHCGLEEGCINISVKKQLTLPGYFRPTKMWDSVVMYKGRLIAAFELKSQVGSFGNNFNNRTEESLGSALDFWTANREKAFNISNYSGTDSFTDIISDHKQPFLGYLMMLEDCNASTTSVRVEESHYKVFNEFKNTSYAKRYQILCEKLVQENLYSSAALILSKRDEGSISGEFNTPHESLSPKSLFADFAGDCLPCLKRTSD